jgi:hypothetical protein
MMSQNSPQDYFRMVLLTVVSQAFNAAGYSLEERPVQWAGGQFRFAKMLENGQTAYVEFQLLAYSDTPFAAGNPSRFRVTLSRSDGLSRTLSALVVEDFGVSILPSPDYWWVFRNTTELGQTLAEAGHLVVAYGMPYLSGELVPPSG